MAPMKLSIRKHEAIHKQLMKGLQELDLAKFKVGSEVTRSKADTLHLERLLAKLQAANLIIDEATKEFYQHFKPD